MAETYQGRPVTHRYRFRGGAAKMWRCLDPEILVEGPAGTGKTTALLMRVFMWAEQFPGSRYLIARQTRASMTQSVLVTFEEKVIPHGHPALEGPSRASRREYIFPNGSVIVVAGLADPGRTYSTEFDKIVIFEATETTEDTWERLQRALRYGRTDRHQILADCNPDAPTHWLNVRANSGRLTRIVSRHTDNPSLGPDYLARLSNLTGVRRSRLFLGLWVAAEGAIYGDWAPALHVKTMHDVPRLGSKYDFTRVVGGVDWGFTAPGCLQVWGLDRAGRLWRVAEVYHTRKTIDWWVTRAQALQARWGVDVWACDPSEPGFIESFRRAGLPAVPAENRFGPGVDAVRDRMNPARPGGAALFVVQDAHEFKDPELGLKAAPEGLEDEIPSYVYARTADGRMIHETPADDQDDHACDAMRYAVYHVARFSPERAAPTSVRGTYAELMGLGPDGLEGLERGRHEAGAVDV